MQLVYPLLGHVVEAENGLDVLFQVDVEERLVKGAGLAEDHQLRAEGLVGEGAGFANLGAHALSGLNGVGGQLGLACIGAQDTEASGVGNGRRQLGRGDPAHSRGEHGVFHTEQLGYARILLHHDNYLLWICLHFCGLTAVYQQKLPGDVGSEVG